MLARHCESKLPRAPSGRGDAGGPEGVKCTFSGLVMLVGRVDRGRLQFGRLDLLLEGRERLR